MKRFLPFLLVLIGGYFLSAFAVGGSSPRFKFESKMADSAKTAYEVLQSSVPVDSSGIPIPELAPITTFSGGRYHYAIGSLNGLKVVNVPTDTESPYELVVPDSVVEGFVVRNFSSINSMMLWFSTEGDSAYGAMGGNLYVPPGASMFIPIIRDTIYILEVEGLPTNKVQVEFGR